MVLSRLWYYLEKGTLGINRLSVSICKQVRNKWTFDSIWNRVEEAKLNLFSVFILTRYGALSIRFFVLPFFSFFSIVIIRAAGNRPGSGAKPPTDCRWRILRRLSIARGRGWRGLGGCSRRRWRGQGRPLACQEMLQWRHPTPRPMELFAYERWRNVVVGAFCALCLRCRGSDFEAHSRFRCNPPP